VWNAVTLREKHRRKIPKNIFGPKREEITGGWRRLKNEEL
jgi:hypothetical protein